MKTINKTLSFLFVGLFSIVLGFALSVMPNGGVAYAQSGTYVFDEYGVLTDAQFNELETQATNLANEYGMGVYLLTVGTMNGNSSPTSEERTNFATSYYTKKGLGLGSGKDGIMLVIAVQSRDYVTIAYGQGSYSFSDSGISKMESSVKSQLKSDNWYGGCKAYYDETSSQLAYYAKNGKPEKPKNLTDWVIFFGVVLVLPALIAALIINKERRGMKTAEIAHEASDYVDHESLSLSVATDQFVNSTVVATPRAKDNDSDGGGWGGGGGGGFSSSGGGKF